MMPRDLTRRGLLMGGLGVRAAGLPIVRAATLRVAGAADLEPVMGQLGQIMNRSAEVKLEPILGSTGLLARQIEQGAPFDVFMAADDLAVDRLVQAGKVDTATRAVYATGRLAVWSRERPIQRLEELSDSQWKRIALADPAHAPYGRAAMQALEKSGLLSKVRGRLVYGENVRQAMEFVRTGNADACLVSLSLAKVAGGKSHVIKPDLYASLHQTAAVVQGTRQLHPAKQFVQLLLSSEVQKGLQAAGFGSPPKR